MLGWKQLMSLGIRSLLKEKRFFPFFMTQFFGAFNDNAFKLATLTLISYTLTNSQAQSEYYQSMAGALFILPFFLFSATAGQLADKYDKTLMIRLIKVFEVFLIIVGSFALYYGSILFMMVTLTGLGIHSAFFGPIKYAFLPEHIPKQQLLAATGLVEGSTFIAILLGTTMGTLAIGISQSSVFIAVFITLVAAFSGLVFSLFIPASPLGYTNVWVNYNFWRATQVMLKQVARERNVLVAVLTISWFWLIGAVLLTKLPDYTHYVLNTNTDVFAFFLALFSLGIAFGSFAINRILKGHVTLTIVPYAMAAFSVFTFDLYWASPVGGDAGESMRSLVTFFTYLNHWRIAVDLFLLAFCAGLFVVPLYTYLQIASPVDRRARTIAANNIYNALFMVLGTGLVMLLLHLKMTIPQVFLILSLLNALAALGLWLVLQRLAHQMDAEL